MNDETEFGEILGLLKIKHNKQGEPTIAGLDAVQQMITDHHRITKKLSFNAGKRTGERITLFKLHSTVKGMRRYSPGYGNTNAVLDEFLERFNKMDSK